MKKNLITVSKLMLLCFIVVMVSSCGNVSKKLVGTWEAQDNEMEEKNIGFIRDMKEDGTFQDKIIMEITEDEGGFKAQMNIVILIDGKWDAKGKFYAFEYDMQSAKMEEIESAIFSAKEEEKAEYEERVSILTDYGLELFTSELPKGRQQYFNLKVNDAQFSYLTEDGEETWKKVEN